MFVISLTVGPLILHYYEQRKNLK